jgi:hypothetical protein
MSGRFDRRQSPVELRRGPRFRSAFTGSHPLNCAPRSLVPGLGTHRCVHVVTLRGGRTGRSEARSAHRHAPHTGCPARARGPGRGRYSLSGAALNLGPTRGSRHATAHHPLGRGRGILAAAAPQAAYPLARLGWALGETEGAGWPTRGTGAPSNPVLLLCAYAETITGAIPTPEANSRV